MDKDEIIRMAREADIEVAHMNKPMTDAEVKQAWIQRFAALVAEHEGKRLLWVCEKARFHDSDEQHIEWYRGFDACAAVLNAERIE